jgi:hypothetical protein
LSGPKACLGSTNEVKIFAAFLHSPVQMGVIVSRIFRTRLRGKWVDRSTRTVHRRGQRIVDPERHICGICRGKTVNSTERGVRLGNEESPGVDQVPVSQVSVGLMTADAGR